MNNLPFLLVFGDSYVFATDPEASMAARESIPFTQDDSWTGQLMNKLDGLHETGIDGMCGRTTNLDDPKQEGRNGLAALKELFERTQDDQDEIMSGVTFDTIVLMLGTNDAKLRFNRSAEDIKEAMRELIQACKQHNPDAHIILVSPVRLDPLHEGVKPYFGSQTTMIEQLSSSYQDLAEQELCSHLNLSEHLSPSTVDGVHLRKEDQPKLAQLVYDKIASHDNV